MTPNKDPCKELLSLGKRDFLSPGELDFKDAPLKTIYLGDCGRICQESSSLPGFFLVHEKEINIMHPNEVILDRTTVFNINIRLWLKIKIGHKILGHDGRPE